MANKRCRDHRDQSTAAYLHSLLKPSTTTPRIIGGHAEFVLEQGRGIDRRYARGQQNIISLPKFLGHEGSGDLMSRKEGLGIHQAVQQQKLSTKGKRHGTCERSECGNSEKQAVSGTEEDLRDSTNILEAPAPGHSEEVSFRLVT